MAENGEIWVVIDQSGGEINEVTFEMLGEGRKIADRKGQKLCAVFFGAGGDASIDRLAHYGADKIYRVENEYFASNNKDACAYALVGLIGEYKPYLIILSASPTWSELAARTAARLKVGLMSNCTQLKINLKGALEATKPVFQDKFYATVNCISGSPQLVTIKPGTIGIAREDESRKAEEVVVKPAIPIGAIRARVTGVVEADPKTIDLAEAEFVVGGGRGVGEIKEWHVVDELAGAIGAAVGGSRAAMDKGCVPRERMVGQTGKVIAPKLYFAVGISGATQHLDGLRGAKFIIAVNKDKYAPIFKLANLAVVANLHELIPAILKKLGNNAKPG